MTLVLFFIIGYMLAAVYEFVMIRVGRKINSNNDGLIINGYLLHHSLYGLLFIVLAIFISNFRLQFLAIGIGIITQHYFTGDGLVFITKGRKRTNQ